MLSALTDRLRAAWRERAFMVKAISFATVGLANAVVDFSVFFLARAALSRLPAADATAAQISAACGCLDADTILLVPANLAAWVVAVSGSYVMNSRLTFARETGGKLSWRAYAAFAAVGVAGFIANTTTLVLASQALPVWIAKIVAILAGFVVNFSLSHFVVFRTPRP